MLLIILLEYLILLPTLSLVMTLTVMMSVYILLVNNSDTSLIISNNQNAARGFLSLGTVGGFANHRTPRLQEHPTSSITIDSLRLPFDPNKPAIYQGVRASSLGSSRL